MTDTCRPPTDAEWHSTAALKLAEFDARIDDTDAPVDAPIDAPTASMPGEWAAFAKRMDLDDREDEKFMEFLEREGLINPSQPSPVLTDFDIKVLAAAAEAFQAVGTPGFATAVVALSRLHGRKIPAFVELEREGTLPVAAVDATTPPPAPVVLVPSDILNAPDPPLAIFGHGPTPGTLALLTAESGKSKSFLALELAVTVATGVAVFPTFTMDAPGTVLYLSYEDPPSVIRQRLNHIGRLQDGLEGDIDRALRTGQLQFFCAAGPVFRYDRQRGAVLTEWGPALNKVITESGAKFVVLDPLSGLAELADENSNSEVGAVARALADLAAKHDTTILLIHHASKGRAEESTQHMGRGASSLACRCRWISTLTAPRNAPDTIELRIVKDSYRRPPAPVFLTRGFGGALSEMDRPEVSPTEIAEFVAEWLTRNPDAILTQVGLSQNRGADAQECHLELVSRWAWATGNDISKSIGAGLKSGILTMVEVARPNRTKAKSLRPGTLTTDACDDEEVPF